MTKHKELLTPDEAVEVLYGQITAQGIRKRVREGTLPCYQKKETPGKVFVKRTELLALYAEKFAGWRRRAAAMQKGKK